MPYFERRISFIVLKADCFSDNESNAFDWKEELLPLLNSFSQVLAKRSGKSEGDFFKRDRNYDTVFNYADYEKAQFNSFKARVDALAKGNELSEDDIEFIQLSQLYFNCSVYFNDSWYAFPEIRFSENFYSRFFNSAEKKLFEHYLYDNDTTSEFRLPIAEKFPGKYDYIPAPHIIEKSFATQLLSLLKASTNRMDSFLKEESDFFKEILEGVLNDKYTLIIKTYI